MSHRLPVADIQFISDFAAFCRTKGDEAYQYSLPCGCACAQFLKASGRAKRPDVGAYHWTDDDGTAHPFADMPDDSMWAVPSPLSEAIVAEPYTFSALADRLEALIADTPVVAQS